MENNKITDIKDIFFCYSLRMFYHLKSQGHWYMFKDRNPSTDRFYFAFKRTDELMKDVTAYTNEKRKQLEINQ